MVNSTAIFSVHTELCPVQLALARKVALFADGYYVPDSQCVFSAGTLYLGLKWPEYEADLS